MRIDPRLTLSRVPSASASRRLTLPRLPLSAPRPLERAIPWLASPGGGCSAAARASISPAPTASGVAVVERCHRDRERVVARLGDRARSGPRLLAETTTVMPAAQARSTA